MTDGILLLDKPLGLSSNAALQRVRRALGGEKAGHVGSLDPLATGMLPICVGEATKFAGEIVGGRKCYRFDVTLGARMSTGDAEGEVVERADVPSLAQAAVESALQRFVGRQAQVPPMYSALKRGGRPLYRLARAGIEVDRPTREIEVHAIRLLAIARDPAVLSIEVLCSKGTYVRVLAEDIARALGTCGHVSRLRREYVAPFEGEPMYSLDALEAASSAGATLPVLATDAGLKGLSAVQLDAAAAARIAHGQSVNTRATFAAQRVRVYGPGQRFLGLGEISSPGELSPKRLMALR